MQQRGIIKGRLTRLSNYIIAENIENIHHSEIHVRYEQLSELWKLYNDIFEGIISTEDSEEVIASHEQDLIRFEEQYFETKANFEQALNMHVPVAKNITVVSKEQSSVQIPNNVQNHVQNHVQLPKISLPIFNGEYNNWLIFKETFTALIHDNTQLTNIEKYHYLKSALKEHASNTINKVVFSSEGYTIAWNALLTRYDNNRMLIDHHIKGLFNLQSLNGKSAIQLQSFIDDFTVHLRALETLEQPVQHWGNVLIHLITSRLDMETLKQWEYKIGQNQLPTFEELQQFLQSRARMLESLDRKHDNTQGNIKQQFQFNKRSSQPVKTMIVTDSNTCRVCNQNEQHKLYHCQTFVQSSVGERRDIVKKLGLCFNCLGYNHTQDKCIARSCTKCNQRHNTLLHYQSYNNSNNQQSAQQQLASSSSNYRNGSASVNPFSSKPSVSASAAMVTTKSSSLSPSLLSVDQRGQHELQSSIFGTESASMPGLLSDRPHCFQSLILGTEVLLSTAIIKVRGKHQDIYCRALLDSASQSNFISEHLAQLLGIKRSSVNIPVSGLNHSTTNIKHQVSTHFIMHGRFQ